MDYSKKAYDEAIAAKDEAMAAKDAAIRSENAIKEFIKNYNASEADSSNNDGDGDVKKQGKKVYWYSVSIMFIEFIYVYYVYYIYFTVIYGNIPTNIKIFELLSFAYDESFLFR